MLEQADRLHLASILGAGKRRVALAKKYFHVFAGLVFYMTTERGIDHYALLCWLPAFEALLTRDQYFHFSCSKLLTRLEDV
jgi:hypothetical protein